MEIYIACQSHPASTAYNLPQVLPFSKRIDSLRLADSLRQIWVLRETLRTRILQRDDGEPLQYADPDMPFPLTVSTMGETEALRFIEQEFVRPFQLIGHAPLVRFQIIETEKHNYLLIDIHHIIADGRTIADCMVHHDLPAAYEGHTLMAQALTLYDHADEEHGRLGNDDYLKDQTFYREQFRGLQFTQLSSPSLMPMGKRGHATANLPRQAIDQWCAQHSISPNILLMGAFAIVLSRMGRSSEAVFATLHHGRTDRRLSTAYGMFVKTMAVKVSCDNDKTVGELLHDLRHWQFTAARHPHYPFTHLCQDLRQSPAATFAFQGGGIQEYATLAGETVATRQPVVGKTANDLSCIVYQDGDRYEIRTEASMSLITPELLQAVATATRHCAQAMTEDIGRAIRSIGLTEKTAQAALHQLGSGIPIHYDDSQTFVSLFLRQAKTTPDHTAVSDGTHSLTYRQLADQSARLATELSDKGVGRGDHVVITAGQTIGFLVAAIATERCGAAYVPADPSWPEPRLHQIIEDCKAKAVCDGHISSGAAKKADINRATPDGIAYVIFTSGTTGRPKGVCISHRAKLNLIHAIVRLWRLQADSRICCHSSVAFDASVEDLFPVLTTGGTLFILPSAIRHDIPAIHRFIADHHISGGCFTTQFGLMLLRHQDPHMSYICLGGEKLTVNPHTSTPVVNTYGPTEFTVDATYHWLKPEKEYADIPIGRPFPNQHAVILDPCGHMLPHGAVGELCLAGTQRFSGYLSAHATENSQEGGHPAIAICAAADADGYYHTGDLCRWNAEGELEYIGRSDRQVKLRGYRVEPAAIETSLQASGMVGQAFVDYNAGQQQLIAYITDKEGAQPASTSSIRQWLQTQLPAFMIPAHFIRLPQMPLTSSGKIDRTALPLPQHGKPNTAQPKTEQERVWCQLFADTLGIISVSPDDSFFDLGGTSLLAMSLQAEASKAGLHICYNDIFSHTTPRTLAQLTSEPAHRGSHNGEKDISDEIPSYDYGPIHRLISEDHAHHQSPCDKRDDAILLTGATGFLGCHVLRQILLDQENDVVCVVRQKAGRCGLQRLEEVFSFYFAENSLKPYANRLHIIEKDICSVHSDDVTLPLGMIIHCAADIHHRHEEAAIAHTNIAGTSRMIELAKASGARLIHISTVSVGGMGGSEPLTEHTLYVGQTFSNTYVRSKFLAERAVLEAAAGSAVDVRVMRVGNLSPRAADGKFRRDSLTGMEGALRGISQLGCYPKSLSAMPFDRSAVDETANAILLLADSKTAPVVLMPVNPHRVELSVLFAHTDINPVEDQEFERKLHQALTDKSREETLLQLLNLYEQARQSHGVPTDIDNSLTNSILHSMHFDWTDTGKAVSPR